MMRLIHFLFFVAFAVSVAAAQERFVLPVDEAKQDPSFAAFRAELIAAVERRDAKYVSSIVDRDMINGFDSSGGPREFERVWKLNSADSKFWETFLPVIKNGGRFVTERRRRVFFAPYTFDGFPKDLDTFEYHAIFGANVNLREKPQRDAPVAAVLSYNVVKTDPEQSVKIAGKENEFDWMNVETLGGQKGFVKAEFVRGPIDYRAGFEKIRGKWKMNVFIAGD